MKQKKRSTLAVIIIAGVAVILGVFFLLTTRFPIQQTITDAVCSGEKNFAAPIFTNADEELRKVSDPSFTKVLFDQATALEPALAKPGTQVHLGFWSGPGNHGNLVKLLDAVNNYKAPDNVIHKAIWDEGSASSIQYPAYVRINRQGWYERAYPSPEGKVTLFGVARTDPEPIDAKQADEIWGQYSTRYADLAVPFKQATGKTVQVWCFVEGAKANRIFYTFEFPELVKLEEEGVVEVHFARHAEADWTKPYDWITGTALAPKPTL